MYFIWVKLYLRVAGTSLCLHPMTQMQSQEIPAELRSQNIKMAKVYFISFCVFLFSLNGSGQSGQILQLRNCQKESRIVTYQNQVSIFWQLVAGWTTLRDQKWLKFSSAYTVDTSMMEKQIERIRKSLPENYFKSRNLMGEWYDHSPEEKGVWFTVLFTNGQQDSKLKLFSAVKIVFTGEDARVESNRADPKILQVEFILDQGKLDAIRGKLLPLLGN